jgi:catechol 2,3-dioxygenase-like lactoylglutathione lyase family enzyme
MAEAGSGVRLRQAVLVARELEPLAEALREQLGLREPFRDPGVKEFGLHNVVFALDDCFLEVVSPVQPGTAGGRYLDRHGDGGYMLLFDVRDLEQSRARAAALGVRVVWQIDLPDISGTHLHPADIGGAIVSVDRSVPYGTWRWGGPDWTGRTGEGAPVRLLGVTVAVQDPDATAARWGEVLGLAVQNGAGGPRLELDGGEVRFRRCGTTAGTGAADAPAGAGGARGGEGLTEISLALPPERRAGRDSLELGGVTLRLSEER